VADFHNFSVWNGQKKINCKRYSLGMAKKVCEDWANLLMNEKVDITLEGKKEQEFIDEVFAKNDFEVNMNELQEKCAARGTYAVIPHVDGLAVDESGNTNASAAEITMDFISGGIYPLSWRGRNITECAFATELFYDGNKYVYLQIHVLRENRYVIESRMYENTSGTLKDVPLSTVPNYANVPDSYTAGERPQFVIGRYNIANNIEDNNPMGISVYANAIDVLKGVDTAYDSYVNEFVLGKKRIMIKPAATKNEDGDCVYDPNDVTFYVLPEDISDGDIIKPIDMSLRTQEHTQGLQDQLNMLSSKCGFGDKHYKFDNGNVSTATQIISENSEMFRTIKKHEIVLEAVLVDICRLLLYMGNVYMNRDLDENVEISVDFDDSIIEDKTADFEKDMRLLNAGIMNDWEFRAKWMNEDPETAKASLPSMEDMNTEKQDEVE